MYQGKGRPLVEGSRRVRVDTRFSEEEIEMLDELVFYRGISRSEVIREAVRQLHESYSYSD